MTGSTFGVPAHALSEWDALHRAIIRAGSTPCADESVRDYWTGSVGQQRLAAERCLDCPVMVACAAYAAVADEREGVWGGVTSQERKPA